MTEQAKKIALAIIESERLPGLLTEQNLTDLAKAIDTATGLPELIEVMNAAQKMAQALDISEACPIELKAHAKLIEALAALKGATDGDGK